MPVYRYRHTISGKLREVLRPVAERDNPLAGGPWERVTVPLTVVVAGAARGIQSQTQEDAVREKFYRMEQAGELQKHFSPREIADAHRVWVKEPSQGYEL